MPTTGKSLGSVATWVVVVAWVLMALACVPPAPTPIAWPLAECPVHRHETLGVEARYPPGWQMDSQEWFVWFTDGPQAAQSFNIANANFGMTRPSEFLEHLGVPVEMTKTVVLDGQPALFLQLQPVAEAEGYRSAVAVVTPCGENLTIGGKSEPVLFNPQPCSVSFIGITGQHPAKGDAHCENWIPDRKEVMDQDNRQDLHLICVCE